MLTDKSILVVEDETDLAELICFNLHREGYRATVAGDGEAALSSVCNRRPDLIILDRMLPRKSGDDVLSQLKRDGATASIPILMLTAKAEETDELVGLALGADDYVTKPFSMKVLLARVSAILRRVDSVEADAEVTIAGPITLDTSRHEVAVDGKPIALTATEFRILHTLMKARGRVLARDQLIDAVLGRNVAVTDRTIDVHIAGLRKKLGSAATWVQTVRGAGYTFRPPT